MGQTDNHPFILVEGLDKTFTTKIVKFFCELLGIEVPRLHVFVVDEMKQSGVCYQNAINDYMICLKSQADGQMLVTLAHELTHVKQFLLNNLSEEFDNSIPYKERWWEQEAYTMEVELVKSLIDAVNNGKI